MNKVLFLLFFTVFSGFSQVSDANMWLGLGVKADITKDLKLAFEAQTRFDQNYSNLSNYFNELSAEYDLPFDFSVGVSYRYSRKNRISHFEGENRVCLNLEHSFKVKPLDLKFKSRARYQYAFDRLNPSNDLFYSEDKSSFRIKFNLQYEKYKRIQPYLTTELFKTITPYTNYTGLNGLRLIGGLEFDLPARHSLDLAYIRDQEFDSQIKIAHIIALRYTYELSSKLFKKKKK